MDRLRHEHVAFAVAIVLSALVPLHVGAQGLPEAPSASADSVPTDLRPLLAPHRSEMRLVVTRYTMDRTLLTGNYAGAPAGRGGAPRGGTADSASTPPITFSTARIARLKRFDLSWQAALTRIDAGKLSADARADRDSLLSTIQGNLAQLDREAVDLHDVAPSVPFAPKLVALIEARIRIEDVDPERAAGVLTEATKEIGTVRDRLRSELTRFNSTSIMLPANATRQVGATVDRLRGNLAEWFNFYNGYDPLFTWWMGLPYRHADAALQGYAAFLRDTVAPATRVVAMDMDPETDRELHVISATIPPAPRSRFGDVPDLAEILALPQDELTGIVQRFRGTGSTGRGRGNAPAASAVHDTTFFRSWLGALQTLDFDHLSRNAQVDYLYLKKMAELELARAGSPLPATAPRKADSSGIPGTARGRDGLIRDLQDEMIPYTPEQLIALAEREFAWCDREMLKASREMGFGDNWKAALEKTKTMHVPPGGQPRMVKDLIVQAIAYLRAKDLVTVPEVAAESQRMVMMSSQAQLSNPFFLGGSLIQVSFPTDAMEFDAREQSMRGNNRPWSHATAFHEMIPGHNLAGYYAARYAGYRANLGAAGPFFTEGWALYWELILYDKGFDRTPEERVGALFWRMHRCARIIFSLRFHMGQWSPQEAVDFLVSRVGHEPDNARAEVRRSFQGGYGPLYQAAYLLGGLELRGLRHELVDSKQMTEKAFHDEVLRQGSMPIALLRLAMTRQPLSRDMNIDWKFYGDLPER